MRDGHERRPDCKVSISPSAVSLMPEMRRTPSSLSFSSRSDWRLTHLRRGNLAPPLDIDARARANLLRLRSCTGPSACSDIGGAGGDLANVRPTMSDRTSVGFRRRSPVRYDMPLTFWKLAKTRPKARWGNGDSHATASIRRTACTASRLPTDQGKLSRGRSLLCPLVVIWRP